MTSIPFLPGNSYKDHSRTRFHKSHQLDLWAGDRHVTDPKSRPTRAEALQQAAYLNLPTTHNYLPPVDPSTGIPSYLALDRQVLRFEGYFKEAVHESRIENYRVRKCVILFYLEDDTIQVTEMKQENSGMPQGVFIKRHKIPKPDGTAHSWLDLYCGAELTLYGRTFRLCSCDPFTRSFFAANDRDAGAESAPPEDPSEQRRLLAEASRFRVSTKPTEDPLRQFLANDRKVLRFYCYWDDRPNMYGEGRCFVLHYFLADDTVELLEAYPANSGRDPFPALLRRTRLPKVFANLSDLTNAKEQCYSQRDLAVGNVITVFGRQLFIYGCDEFTKKYYKDTFDVEFEDMVSAITEPIGKIPDQPVPPHNGYGTEEDSMANFLSLVPKPPRTDLQRAIENDRKVLRWAAKLQHAKPEDVDRRFVVTYYLADGTISVYEPPQKNSGFVGGKFIERTRAKNPATGTYYKETEIAASGLLELRRWVFEILEADQYTQNHLGLGDGPVEQRRVVNDVPTAKEELRRKLFERQPDLRHAFRAIDMDKNGFVTIDEIERVLKKFGLDVKEELLMDIMVAFDKNRDGKIGYDEFCSAMK